MTYTETLESNNFVAKLSNEQKIIFLKTLFHLANIDGTRDEQEIKYIKDVAIAYQIEDTEEIFKEISNTQNNYIAWQSDFILHVIYLKTIC